VPSPPEGSPHVCLIGLPGVGKSSVAIELANLLDAAVVDLDDDIEARSHRTIPEIFETDGEDGFRALESSALAAMIDGPDRRVISTGGGVVTTPESRTILSDALCVWLRADLELLARRLAQSPIERPLLSGDLKAELALLSERREPLYREVAHVTIDIGVDAPEQIARRIHEAIR
jgi:shikimate kinase